MAIGPTGGPPLPTVPGGQVGPVVPQGEAGREVNRARNADRGTQALEFQDVLRAEPLDEVERRQSDLERTAEQIGQLNPNAPRGSIIDISV